MAPWVKRAPGESRVFELTRQKLMAGGFFEERDANLNSVTFGEGRRNRCGGTKTRIWRPTRSSAARFR